ncbi:MAG: UvrD-helicase domain-containing protein [Desulfobacteraceae bacterium]|jgi:DNA helicase II / ATP-dependent DNA helicase PcrA
MQPGIAYPKVLNPAQLTAATFGRGPLLVIAGAGSGKTRTLTYRVAKLVEEGVAPESILLLSFTRKASQEMLKRASLLLDKRCQKVAGGTFHSFANMVLKRYARKIGFAEGYSIIDRADAETLIGMIRKELETAEGHCDLPRKSTLANIFSRSINKAVPIEEVIYEDYPQFGHASAAIHTLWRMYQARKREHLFCDYDDLLVYLRQLLVENPEIRNRLAAQYEYILVDEYQDTNLIQADIIFLLSGPDSNVMVVGDDAQSIYAFRGANFKNIITFPDRFPGTRLIKLEENYRSRQPILDLTNAIIEVADEKYAKHLFTRRSGGQRPALVACSSENAQSRFIIDKLIALTGSGVALQEIAVLFRAGFHSFDLEVELGRHAVPFVKYGGFKFTESAHIKDLLAHLRILATSSDRLSWDRVLRLISKVGPKSAQTIYANIIRTGRGAQGLLQVPTTKSQAAALEPLKELIAAVVDAPLSLVQTGELILQYYLPILKRQYDDHPRRLRDLQQMLSIMERYDNLQDFLADMVLEPPTSSIEGSLAASSQEVQHLVLSTVHSAKGLEWHSVFLIWALDGRFPSHHSLERPDALEEERRLMYVAATRARENLFITYPAQAYDRSSQSYLYRPSRFLEHIGEDLMERVYYR